MSCLRASVTKSARTVLKHSLGLSAADQSKLHCVIQALKEIWSKVNTAKVSSIDSTRRRKYRRLGIESKKQASQCEYENFENELMRDQFIAGLVSKQIRVELIGKGHRHEDEERQKVSLRESKWLRLQKQYEATTITNKLMKDARGNQNQSEQINYTNNQGRRSMNRDSGRQH